MSTYKRESLSDISSVSHAIQAAALEFVPRLQLSSRIPAALDDEAERLIASARTESDKEAVRAFVKKRDPIFTGR